MPKSYSKMFIRVDISNVMKQIRTKRNLTRMSLYDKCSDVFAKTTITSIEQNKCHSYTYAQIEDIRKKLKLNKQSMEYNVLIDSVMINNANIPAHYLRDKEKLRNLLLITYKINKRVPINNDYFNNLLDMLFIKYSITINSGKMK